MTIKIERSLEQLRMLADWQIRNLGYDPQKVTTLLLRKDAGWPKSKEDLAMEDYGDK